MDDLKTSVRDHAGKMRIVRREPNSALQQYAAEVRELAARESRPAGIAPCPTCLGAGWLTRNVPVTDPRFGKLLRCPECGPQKDAAYLERYANLSEDMLGFRFAGYWRRSYVECLNDDDKPARDYDAPLDACRQVLDRRGWATFVGPNGLGKTYLLAATVNEARDLGLTAMYVTMAELLNVLRREIKAGDDVQFDALRRRLWECAVLAVDEVDRFQHTDWTSSMLWELVDHREREWRKVGTLFATNSFGSLPDYLQSRMTSGRYALIEMRGGDVRPDLRR